MTSEYIKQEERLWREFLATIKPQEAFPVELIEEMRDNVKKQRMTRMYDLSTEIDDLKKQCLLWPQTEKEIFEHCIIEPRQTELQRLSFLVQAYTENRAYKTDINIVKQVPILQVLEALNIDHRRSSNDRYMFKMRPSEKTASAVAYVSTNRWHDYGDGSYGSVIDIVMHSQDVSVGEAIKYLGFFC